jgi:hypothetical protein
MPVNVLLVGLQESVVEAARNQLAFPNVELGGATDLDGIRSAFARMPVDHVIMGAGLDLDTRLDIVREIFTLSTSTTVHMKDRASGPDSFLPFARSILTGLA